MIVREFREAWRRLARRPGYALLSVAVLGVGLGVTLFLFSLVNTLILEPLPVPHPERLMALGEPSHSGNGIGSLDSDQYLALRDGLRSADEVGAYVPIGAGVEENGGARYYPGSRVTASMMPLLGVTPLLGRGLLPSDEAPGAADVVLLGENLWRRGFKADPHIAGRAVRINGEWATVVGVVSEVKYAGLDQPDDGTVYWPLSGGTARFVVVRTHGDPSAIATLCPGHKRPQPRADGGRRDATAPYLRARADGWLIAGWVGASARVQCAVPPPPPASRPDRTTRDRRYPESRTPPQHRAGTCADCRRLAARRNRGRARPARPGKPARRRT